MSLFLCSCVRSCLCAHTLVFVFVCECVRMCVSVCASVCVGA